MAMTRALTLRIASSVVLAPLVIAAIWYGSWPFWGMVLLAFAIGVYEWLSVASKTDIDFPASVFGIIYIAFCMVCFALLRGEGVWVVLVLITAVWLSDTGAYAAGKMIGGPKMAPRISPNKTWAGLGGAIVGASFSFIVFSALGLFQSPLWMTLIYGIMIALSGQAGDLLVSALKRRAGVKDMGHIIPGHGGLLDRIDSLLLASPIFFFALKGMNAL